MGDPVARKSAARNRLRQHLRKKREALADQFEYKMYMAFHFKDKVLNFEGEMNVPCFNFIQQGVKLFIEISPKLCSPQVLVSCSVSAPIAVSDWGERLGERNLSFAHSRSPHSPIGALTLQVPVV